MSFRENFAAKLCETAKKFAILFKRIFSDDRRGSYAAQRSQFQLAFFELPLVEFQIVKPPVFVVEFTLVVFKFPVVRFSLIRFPVLIVLFRQPRLLFPGLCQSDHRIL